MTNWLDLEGLYANRRAWNPSAGPASHLWAVFADTRPSTSGTHVVPPHALRHRRAAPVGGPGTAPSTHPEATPWQRTERRYEVAGLEDGLTDQKMEPG